MDKQKETQSLTPIILAKMMSAALAHGFSKHPGTRWLFTNCLFFIDVSPSVLDWDIPHINKVYLGPLVDEIITRLKLGEDISRKTELPFDSKDAVGAVIEYHGISCGVFFETTEAKIKIYFDVKKILQFINFL